MTPQRVGTARWWWEPGREGGVQLYWFVLWACLEPFKTKEKPEKEGAGPCFHGGIIIGHHPLGREGGGVVWPH